ncbi:hypothetical protein [Luteibacter yeojuensis]|uniref:Uncharacterized protein n=1 Tax=Luteibacter yeojuensis TaxID=345309 RepID=A0A7X5QT67_9GAMM|nr:hypothetical protein [Luteibacter yeojuensis]NID14963.1 hypothetical protein [Luteibacter yeojuensis]
MQSYALKGGLDLSTGKATADPGTLLDCLNYEVTDRDGYTRITGFERFDGQFRVAEFRTVRMRGALVSGSFLPGDEVMAGGHTGYVTSAARGTGWALYVMCHSRDPWPLELPATITNLSRAGSATITAADLMADPVGKQKVVNAARKALADAARPLVGLVPGNPDVPVSGVFWFKNRLYAIRDYPLIWFESAKQWPFRVGDQVTMPGGVYTVVAVHYTSQAYLAGYMVLWPIGQDGQPMTVAPEPGDQVTRPSQYTGFDAAGAAMGELPVAMMGMLSYGDGKATMTSPGTGVQPENDDLSVRAYRTPAGLWKATATGWQPVDLKREAQFSSGTSAFGQFINTNIGIGAAPLASGYKAGTKALLDGIDVTAEVAADDGSGAALSGNGSDELRVTGCDLSAIPDTATILGIEVRVKRYADVGHKVEDYIAELIGIDGTSTNKARQVTWDTDDTEVVYGGEDDLWGNDNLTPRTVKEADFGFRLVTQAVDPEPQGAINRVSLQVYYRRRDAAIYVWTGSLDIAVNLVDAQLITGSYVDGDAAGWLVLDIPGASWAPSIGNGMQIRSAPAGGGDLLATVASGDQPIRLPGWPDLQANRSQYRFLATNFYGMADYQAIYGVSGASPAFTYDGSRLLWVRTPVDPQQDLPRHIARHGASLVLGYYQGAYILSPPGDPLNFRGEDGAASIEIGQHLTNLMPAMGDALLVVGETKTLALHGTDADSYDQQTVSDNRGGIEYTGADVGRLLVADAVGIASSDATQAFGDLSRTYLSMKVQAWLKPRLQAVADGTVPLQQVIGAIAVRSKNQYRLYFRDGYYMTLTANDTPEFTKQRYFVAADDPDMPDQPFPISTVGIGIDDLGRERIFGSFDADANRGYVFELDHGTTFDGAAFPSYVVLNPLSFSESVMLKRFDRTFLLGQAEGFAKVRLSRSVNYSVPDGTKAFPFTLGDPLANAGVFPARGVADAPIEGYEVTLRFDSLSDVEGPHTLQAIGTDADPRGDSRGHVRG